MRFGIGQYTHQRHMFAPYSIPAATTFNEQEKDGTKEKKHDYMTHHIAAHLQTLMFLTLRVILMQQGVGSEEEDAAESNAGTNGIQNYQGPHRLGDPPSFEDENYQSELPWLPAAEPYSFDFDPLQHKVFRYPIFGREDIIDTSIQNPDSFTVQETIGFWNQFAIETRLDLLITAAAAQFPNGNAAIAAVAGKALLLM
ncbi:hypothetical protein FOCG_11918 [Fusarium oxysporum f. sp. radicis-lycopersici 26381]|nr:hypothetical protein FOCG_11918 [Fusarium oxysporum f. sp. radicis-lycopersici 26381]